MCHAILSSSICKELSTHQCQQQPLSRKSTDAISQSSNQKATEKMNICAPHYVVSALIPRLLTLKHRLFVIQVLPTRPLPINWYKSIDDFLESPEGTETFITVEMVPFCLAIGDVHHFVVIADADVVIIQL